MSKADTKSCDTIKSVLGDFDSLSKHTINLESIIIYSANCFIDKKNIISDYMSIKGSTNFGNYLGFPIFHKKSEKETFIS